MHEIDIEKMRAGLEYTRNLKHKSKTEMAAIAGIHPNTYRRKEHDPYSFTLIECIRLSVALDMNITDIFMIDTKKLKEEFKDADEPHET